MRETPQDWKALQLIEMAEQTFSRILIAFDWVPSTPEYIQFLTYAYTEPELITKSQKSQKSQNRNVH